MMCDSSIKWRSDKIRELSTKIKKANKAIEEVVAESIRMHIKLSELY